MTDSTNFTLFRYPLLGLWTLNHLSRETASHWWRVRILKIRVRDSNWAQILLLQTQITQKNCKLKICSRAWLTRPLLLHLIVHPQRLLYHPRDVRVSICEGVYLRWWMVGLASSRNLKNSKIRKRAHNLEVSLLTGMTLKRAEMIWQEQIKPLIAPISNLKLTYPLLWLFRLKLEILSPKFRAKTLDTMMRLWFWKKFQLHIRQNWPRRRNERVAE